MSEEFQFYDKLSFSEIISIFLTRFKTRYEDLEKETGIDDLTGSERRKWLKENVQSAFSKENIEYLGNEEAIKILRRFYSIDFGGGPGSTTEDHDEWARDLVEKKQFVEKAKDLLHGEGTLLERYRRFTEIKGANHGITTELLCYFDPEHYGIWYSKSEKALRFFGMKKIDIPKSGKRAGEYYQAFNNELKKLLNEVRKDESFRDADLATLDYIFYDASSLSFWQIAPGKEGRSWDEFYREKIIGIFYHEYLDKAKQEWLILDKESLGAAFRSVYSGTTKKSTDLIHTFTRRVKPGDLIVANRGNSATLGWGIILSPPYLHRIRYNEDYTVFREVKWLDKIERPIPDDFNRKFMTTILHVSEDEFGQLVTAEPTESSDRAKGNGGEDVNTADDIDTDPIKKLLDRKKQIILYGPPGTGKTWISKRYIDSLSSSTYSYEKNSYLNLKFFWLTMNPTLFGSHEDLVVGSKKKFEWKPGRNIKSAFEEIEIGDIAFIYISGSPHKVHRIYAIGKCVEKEGLSPIIEILKLVEGPDWWKMKADSILADSRPVQGHTTSILMPLEQAEASRLLDLVGNISPVALGIELDSTSEKVSRSEFVTFHQSISYEEFIEGLRPCNDDNGNICYSVEEGIFKKICRNAFNALLRESGIKKEWMEHGRLPELDDAEKTVISENVGKIPFFIVIDEINRGDISRIFGELITLLEADKRLFAENELITTLPYSKTKFGIPPNLYLIGTMNTADKSIALIDIALRRRFGFIEMMPDYAVLREKLVSGDAKVQEVYRSAIDLLEHLNARIVDAYDRDHQIGHSYLMKLNGAQTREDAIENLCFVWYHEILPLLQEYFYDSPKTLREILGPAFVETKGRSFCFAEPLAGEAFLAACTRLTGSGETGDAGETE